jgi:multisubunit Na+/H+ antiporter MnhF subunit
VTDVQLADALMQLALAAQTLGAVLRMVVSPIDATAVASLDQAQLEINDVMAILARNGVPRAISDGE